MTYTIGLTYRANARPIDRRLFKNKKFICNVFRFANVCPCELTDNFRYRMFSCVRLRRLSLNRSLYARGSNGRTKNFPTSRREFIELARFGWIITGLLKVVNYETMTILLDSKIYTHLSGNRYPNRFGYRKTGYRY